MVGLSNPPRHRGLLGRYAPPALTLLGAIALYFVPAGLSDSAVTPLVIWLSPCLYLVGAAWWVRRAASQEPPRLWPHLLLVWLPAAPPLLAMATANSDDGEFEYGAFSVVVVFFCLAAAAIMLVRRVPDRFPPTAHDQ